MRAYVNSSQAQRQQEPTCVIDSPATGITVEVAVTEAQPQPEQMHYNPGLLPAPVLLPTGETLYPGETTTITPDPVFYAPATDSTIAPATGNELQPATSAAHHRPARPHSLHLAVTTS